MGHEHSILKVYDALPCASSVVMGCGCLLPSPSGTRLPSSCAGSLRAQKPHKPQGFGEYWAAPGGGDGHGFLECSGLLLKVKRMLRDLIVWQG